MGCELLHVWVDILGIEDGFVLFWGEQHVVQQVNVRPATQGAVQRVIGVVHGEVEAGLIVSKPGKMSVVTKSVFLISLAHFIKSATEKSNNDIKTREKKYV